MGGLLPTRTTHNPQTTSPLTTMASRTATTAIARAVARSAAKPSSAARTFSSVAQKSARPATRQAQAALRSAFSQPRRGVKTLDFAGTKETVYERADWPVPKLQEYFKNDTLALIGYGSQGHGQGLNARDNGLNVIVGVRKDGESWKQALEDGWVPGKTLFPIEEALEKGTIIMNLLSDAAQSQTWSQIKPYIKKDTKVEAPEDVDVILVAPKGSGRTVRTLFKEGRGINASVAVWQDVTGQAKEKAVALSMAVG